MATTTNYTHNNTRRRVDLYVMGPLDFASNEVQLTQQSMAAATGGRVCAGIVKVAQKFTTTFLAYGIINDQTWGCKLGMLLLSNRLGMIKTEMNSVLSSGIKYVAKKIAEDEKPQLPDDERILNAGLVSWDMDLSASKLYVTVSLQTRNGEAIDVIIPISSVIA